jgi:predicted phage terminase large subunit-like protein
MICRELVRSCYTGQNLLVELPPRHGKSTTISEAFPVWFLNEWPERNIILTSYEADFAAKWGRSVRNMIEQFSSQLDVRIRRDSSAANRWDTTDGGGMVTAGVGGPITGRGAHALICDDPVKNYEQAISKTYQEKTWEWWRSTAFTRIEPGGFAVVLMTRWSQDDLGGRIIRHDQETGANKWKVITLPAIAVGDDDPLGRKDGEALWPQRYPLEKLQELKKAVGSHIFSALYQQQPTQLGGGVIKRAWFKYWEWEGSMIRLIAGDGEDRLINPLSGYRFSTTDPAISTKNNADYTVMCEWLHLPTGELILLDRYRDRVEAPELLSLHRSWWARGTLKFMAIESVAYQSSLFQQLTRPINGHKQISVRKLVPDKDKITRSLPAAALVEAGQVFFPKNADWLVEWEDELLVFPNGKHDDQVDNLSYAAELITKNSLPSYQSLSLDIGTRPSPWSI